MFLSISNNLWQPVSYQQASSSWLCNSFNTSRYNPCQVQQPQTTSCNSWFGNILQNILGSICQPTPTCPTKPTTPTPDIPKTINLTTEQTNNLEGSFRSLYGAINEPKITDMNSDGKVSAGDSLTAKYQGSTGNTNWQHTLTADEAKAINGEFGSMLDWSAFPDANAMVDVLSTSGDISATEQVDMIFDADNSGTLTAGDRAVIGNSMPSVDGSAPSAPNKFVTFTAEHIAALKG